MFFILSKTIYFILMPFTLLLILFLVAILSKKPLVKNKILLLIFVLFLFLGNAFISNEALLAWEEAPVPIQDMGKKYDAAIVLTGITNFNKSPKDRVYMNKGADRVLHTIQLYKEGYFEKIIISGGSGSLRHPELKESEDLKKIFMFCGIPDSAIIVENNSQNTRENALLSKEIIEKNFKKDDRFLLITSAFHMKRSMACFQKVGLRPDAFPVDYYSHDRQFTLDVLLLPNEKSLHNWRVLIHEVIGYWVYKLQGYA
jgi:uncharacterized SAM-binding protein YcdF (DUF218 family)